MSKKGLASSIVISVFLTISIILLVYLIPFNMKEEMEAYQASLQEQVDENGEVILVIGLVAAIGALGIMLAGYTPAIIILINSSISLILSIKNRKAEAKWIRILNYVFDGVLSTFIIIAILKIVLFRTGLG